MTHRPPDDSIRIPGAPVTGHGIPWARSDLWAEANGSLAGHIRLNARQMASAMAAAETVRRHLNETAQIMAHLCRRTCIHCPDPCCLRASPWFDLKDLLSLHLTNQPVPTRQTIHCIRDTCCYLGPCGCTLPRLSRPWVCVWYLCPSQKARLRSGSPGRWDRLQRITHQIKHSREVMWRAFVRTAAGNGPDIYN